MLAQCAGSSELLTRGFRLIGKSTENRRYLPTTSLGESTSNNMRKQIEGTASASLYITGYGHSQICAVRYTQFAYWFPGST